jgi:hemerythrin
VQEAIICKIVDYAATHFETEEKYMRKFKFPGYEEHKSEHEKFTAQALDLQKRSREDGFILSLDILNFLKNWLAEHLIATDKKYVDFFQEHGLK